MYQKNKNQNSDSFSAVFQFWEDHKPSRAQLKIRQLGSDSSIAFSMLEKDQKYADVI